MMALHAARAQPAPAPADAGRQAREQVVELPLASGDKQRVLYVAPAKPRGSLVMLPGGAGDVGITPSGKVRHGNDFLVRTRQAWAARGYAVLIPDAFDHQNLRGMRSMPAYATIVAALVALAHAQAKGPVFLMGTSQGAIAAMNGASQAPPGTVAGVVLTESVAKRGGSHESVFDADPQAVRIPALIVANRDDGCDVAAPKDAPRIAAALVHSPDVRVIEVSGGTAQSRKPCASLSPHGYYGIEPQVIDKIAQWLDGRG